MPKIQKQRKQERKTNYKKRLGMLKSGKNRIVIRKTNNYIIMQLVYSSEAKDKVIFGVTSRELLKNGWSENLKGSLKSLPACYLAGYLFGKKLIEKEEKEKILDIGLARNIHGGRIYAALKGIVDAGVEIKVNEKVFPSDDRIMGKHLKEDVQKVFNEVKEKIK